MNSKMDVDNFLKNERFQSINNCVAKKCFDREKCANEKKFLEFVQKCYALKMGKAHMKLHLLMDKCEENYNLRPTSAYVYVNPNKQMR